MAKISPKELRGLGLSPKVQNAQPGSSRLSGGRGGGADAERPSVKEEAREVKKEVRKDKGGKSRAAGEEVKAPTEKNLGAGLRLAGKKRPAGLGGVCPAMSYSDTRARNITDKSMLLEILKTIETEGSCEEDFFFVSHMKCKGQPGWYHAKCKITSVFKMVGSIEYDLRVVYEDDEVGQVRLDKKAFVKLVGA